MVSKTSYEESAARYLARIQRLAATKTNNGIGMWPGLTNLCDFVKDTKPYRRPPAITIVSIQDDSSNISIREVGIYENLGSYLPSVVETSATSDLVIVENISPYNLTLLGGAFDIDPQFFAEYCNVLSWYQMYEDVPERLRALPSARKRESFSTLQFVEPRELYPDDASAYAESVIWADKATRKALSAGTLKPMAGPQAKNYPPMVFTRQTLSVWCRQKANSKGWISIILVDPPFKIDKKIGTLGIAEYRNPKLRPRLEDAIPPDQPRDSFRSGFCRLLQDRCLADQEYVKTCATDPFLILYEGYRIICSEWLVVNEYVKRELASIERLFEKPDPTFHSLELCLRALHRLHRRCMKDRELMTEAVAQCKKRGQPLWPSSPRSPKPQTDADKEACTVVDQYALELEQDFMYALENMVISIARIQKDIDLFQALVAISGGRQTLQENRGLSRLNFMAIMFLPSSTVAAVMGIQTKFGPESNDFWFLWAVAVPLTILVVLTPFLYSLARGGLRWVWESLKKANRGGTSRTPVEEDGENEQETKYDWKHNHVQEIEVKKIKGNVRERNNESIGCMV